MVKCKRCNKEINIGDKVHIVDNNVYCSEECAVYSLTDEIIMNAKEMAKEQYACNATIMNARNTDNDNVDTCIHCGKKLADCDTIVSLEGVLFCSRKCAIERFSEYDSETIAEMYVLAVYDEINPKDIGLGEYEDEA